MLPLNANNSIVKKRPTYEELVECICGFVVQCQCLEETVKRDGFERVTKQGERFDARGISTYEDAEAILTDLGILDEDGFVIGKFPLYLDDVKKRLS